MDQFLEKDPLWFADSEMNKKVGREIDIWKPSDRKEHPNYYKRAFQSATELEVDCDKRSLDKIQMYRLEKYIDVGEYIQKANCYHASYYYFYKYSCFYDPKYVPYLQDDLHKLFPSDEISPLEVAWQPRPFLGEFIKKHNKPL